MRAHLAGLVVLGALASPAHADHRCCGDVPVVGECPLNPATFRPPIARFELGLVDERSSIEPMTGTDMDGQPSGIVDGGKLAGQGGLFRMLLGLDGVYTGMELSISKLARAPRVRAAGAEPAPLLNPPHSDGYTMPDSLTGMRFLGGAERRLGRLVIGGEVAIGLAVPVVGGAVDGEPWVNDPRFTLDLRARAGVAVTPHILASVMTSKSVLRPDEHALMLVVGFSLFPWDGAR